jgi:hypothetical protein
MSEPDDLDAQQDAWEYQQEKIRATQMTAHPDCRDPEHPGCSQCRPLCRQCSAASYSDALAMCIRSAHGDCHGSELWPDGDDDAPADGSNPNPPECDPRA